MDIAEDVLARMGAVGLEYAVEDFSRRIAWKHQGNIEATVASFLQDRSWAEPIIRDAIRDAVAQTVSDMLMNSKMGDVLRDRAIEQCREHCVVAEEGA